MSINDILTGKQSLEPEPVSPYRELAVQKQHSCGRCLQMYEAPVASPTLRCPRCAAITVEAPVPYAATDLRPTRRSMLPTRLVLFGVSLAFFLIGYAFLQSGKSFNAATPAMWTESPPDGYALQMKRLAIEMCSCKDRACADDVIDRSRHISGRPDAESRGLADQARDTLLACSKAIPK